MDKGLTLEQKVDAFLALETHEKKCEYFHANPELAKIFGGHHFPKPKPATETAANEPK
jgi:hypothetical protein